MGTHGSEGNVDIGDWADLYGQISIGNLFAHVENANSDLFVSIDRVEASADREARFEGNGDVYLSLDTERDTESYLGFGEAQFAFNSIDLTNHNGDFHLNWGVDYDANVQVAENVLVTAEVDNVTPAYEEYQLQLAQQATALSTFNSLSALLVAQRTAAYSDYIVQRNEAYSAYSDYLDAVNTEAVYTFEANGNLTFEAPDPGQPDLMPHTTIYGFSTDGGSSISFNGFSALEGQFYNVSDASPKTSANDLWASIAQGMYGAEDLVQSDGPGPGEDINILDHVFVFDTFDETANNQDLNGDGYYSEHLGVLAYDQEIGNTSINDDGNDGAFSAVIFFNDLNGNIISEETFSGGLVV